MEFFMEQQLYYVVIAVVGYVAWSVDSKRRHDLRKAKLQRMEVK